MSPLAEPLPPPWVDADLDPIEDHPRVVEAREALADVRMTYRLAEQNAARVRLARDLVESTRAGDEVAVLEAGTAADTASAEVCEVRANWTRATRALAKARAEVAREIGGGR